MLKYENQYGEIVVDTKAVAVIAGYAATNSFGVCGMAVRNAVDGLSTILNFDNIEKGIGVTFEDNEIVIEMHIVVTFGINIGAITKSITHNVTYAVESATGFKVKTINVYVDSIKSK